MVRAPHEGARVGRAALHLVRRRHPERQRQLPRPPRRGRARRQGRLPLRVRAGRRARPRHHLLRPARRGVPVRQRPAVARDRQGRRGRPLHGHGARARGGDARLRPDRRAARGGVRRLLGRGARRAAGVDRGQGPGHPGRGVAQGRARAAQGHRRRGREARTQRAAHGRAAAHGRRRPHAGRPRPRVGRVRRRPERHLPGRADGGRAHAVRPAHVGHDGQAQGGGAHVGRVPDVRGRHSPLDLRHPGTTTSTGAPPTSAG